MPDWVAMKIYRHEHLETRDRGNGVLFGGKDRRKMREGEDAKYLVEEF